MDFSQLKEKYPFLGEILKLYDTLDKSVDENNVNPKIITYCDKNSSLQMDTTGKHIRICKKLLKNLLLLKGYYNSDFIKNCGNLYVWLYFEIKKSMISNDIIKEIFEFSTSIEDDEVKYNYCSYFLFNDNIPNPENLMKLRIFNDNADTFQNMLMDSINSKDCYLKKYVYECVDIYKKMNKNYSSSGDCSSSQHENACEIIKTFNNLYKFYIFNKQGITHNFPELSSDISLNDIDGCPVEETEPNPNPDKSQHDTPTRGGVSTALSAMVGIPPFLALIYKFTPAGKLFRFGNKKHTKITSNIDKEIENELFHVIQKDSNIKEIHSKYNIGYEPI